MNVLDILLQNEVPAPQTKEFKHKRLSQVYGEDVIFVLKELGFSKVAELKKINEDDKEFEVHVILAGVVEPDLKNQDLMNKYGAITPAELAKKMLLPGEIADMSYEIEKLSGYRTATLEEIKKN